MEAKTNKRSIEEVEDTMIVLDHDEEEADDLAIVKQLREAKKIRTAKQNDQNHLIKAIGNALRDQDDTKPHAYENVGEMDTGFIDSFVAKYCAKIGYNAEYTTTYSLHNGKVMVYIDSEFNKELGVLIVPFKNEVKFDYSKITCEKDEKPINIDISL